MLLQILLDVAPVIQNEAVTFTQMIIGGAAVGGSSTAVTIAVMQAKLKFYKEELERVRAKLNNHISESILFAETVSTLRNDMSWIKETLQEMKSKL